MGFFYELAEMAEDVIVVSSYLAAAALLSSIVVSQYLFDGKYETEVDSNDSPNPEYTSLYNIENIEIELLNEEEKENIKDKYVEEETPAGKVIMKYDAPYFLYFAKSGNIIPYRFLDVVARKFVLQHKCLEFYVKLEEVKNEEVKNEEVKNEEAKSKTKPSVFVQKKKQIKKQKLVEKKINSFKYAGTLEDFAKPIIKERNVKKMTFSEYKKMIDKKNE